MCVLFSSVSIRVSFVDLCLLFDPTIITAWRIDQTDSYMFESIRTVEKSRCDNEQCVWNCDFDICI